jgi:hypothetical protein
MIKKSVSMAIFSCSGTRFFKLFNLWPMEFKRIKLLSCSFCCNRGIKFLSSVDMDNKLGSFCCSIKSMDDLSTTSYIAITLIAYIAGHLLSYCSSMTVERYSEWTLGFPSKFLLSDNEKCYFDIDKKNGVHYLIRLLMFILLLPISVFDIFFGKWLSLRDSYAKKVEEPLLLLINNKLTASLNKAGIFSTHSNDKFFRYFYHLAVEHSKAHLPKMQNYVALFGFMRTLTLLSIVLFWVVFFEAHCLYGFSNHLIFLLGLLSVISIVCYLGFVKFYRRFSLEVLMAVTTL